MFDNGLTPRHDSAQFDTDPLQMDDLTEQQKEGLTDYATSLKAHTQSLLPDSYDVVASCGETQMGVTVAVEVSHYGQPVSGVNINVDDIELKDSDADSDENSGNNSAEQLSHQIVAATVLTMLHNHENGQPVAC